MMMWQREEAPQKNFRHQQISRGCFANSIFKQTKEETSLKDIFFAVSVRENQYIGIWIVGQT